MIKPDPGRALSRKDICKEQHAVHGMTRGAVSEIAPVIVSASRATDIPAFYGEWFVRRLAAGHLVWTNPFNRQQRQHVSFSRTRVIVFWSKNPAPLERFLPELDDRRINYYFTFTLNDYEQEGLEGNVPPLAERLATFRRLAERLGPERVIWRFDPILLGGGLTPEHILEKIQRIGDALHSHTRKLVISFGDVALYRKVRENLKKAGHGDIAEPDSAAVLEIAKGLQRLNEEWGLEIATCAEQADLGEFGISHNRCVDDELLARAFPEDRELLAFLGRGLFTERPPGNPLKDKSQRKACGCIVSKDIGRYDTCPHRCVYCYANSSFAQADEAHRRHKPEGEEI